MDFNKCVFVLAASLTVVVSTQAAVTGYSGVQTYMTKVVSGVTRTYSAIDVFVDCDNAADYIVNVYGQRASSATKSVISTVKNGVINAATATNTTAANGVYFNQGTGTNKGWNPDYDNTDGLFDSFVTIGGRTQDVAGNPDSGNQLAKDPSFANFSSSTSGFGTLRTGTSTTTDAGPGWYAADPNNAMNKAGSYVDLKIMLGHFVVDVTSYLGTSDKIELSFLATYTIKIGGTTQQQNRTSPGSPTQATSSVPLTFDFMPVVPTPGAVALIGVAGAFFGKRRRHA
jgi:hypothetical protein